MKRYGLIGFPLSHSFSQKFFTEKFERDGVKDCVYDNFSIADIDEIPGLLFAHPDLCGLNVTIPYKEKIIAYLDDMNDVVRETGACNCIRISGGKLYGYNTDTTGFKISLQNKLLPVHKKALILGRGGAAKAVAYVLRRLGIEFLYVVRKGNHEADKIRKEHFDVDAVMKKHHDVDTILYSDLNEAIMRSHQLIVNTTPLGTFPDVNSFPPILYDYISADHYLYDMVYNPAKTVFLTSGEQRGAIIQNGADMLAIQAEESWKIWNAPE